MRKLIIYHGVEIEVDAEEISRSELDRIFSLLPQCEPTTKKLVERFIGKEVTVKIKDDQIVDTRDGEYTKMLKKMGLK